MAFKFSIVSSFSNHVSLRRYVVRVGLVKVSKALIRLGSGGTFHPPSDVYVRSFPCPFFTLLKLCYTQKNK